MNYPSTALIAMTLSGGCLLAQEAELPNSVVEKSVASESKSPPKDSYSFHQKPLHFKASGNCEGVELADLDGDGVLDMVSGVPSGQLNFYKGLIAADGRRSFAASSVLTNKQEDVPLEVDHW